MTTRHALAFALAISLTAAATPLSVASSQTPATKVDLTGKWLFDVTTSAGSGTPTVTLTQKGDTLTGHYSSQSLGEAEITGSVKDGKFTFKAAVGVQGTNFDITYTGAVETKDTLKGTVTLGELGSGTFTARRQ
jgi:hypothetical protein